MRWTDLAQYVDDEGRIVAEIFGVVRDAGEEPCKFRCIRRVHIERRGRGRIGDYVTLADAERAVERWWIKASIEILGRKR